MENITRLRSKLKLKDLLISNIFGSRASVLESLVLLLLDQGDIDVNTYEKLMEEIAQKVKENDQWLCSRSDEILGSAINKKMKLTKIGSC